KSAAQDEVHTHSCLSRVPHTVWGTETPWRELAGLTDTDLPFSTAPTIPNWSPHHVCGFKLAHYRLSLFKTVVPIPSFRNTSALRPGESFFYKGLDLDEVARQPRSNYIGDSFGAPR
ncbi:MAG TPA: hypothetical protein VK596_08050, partial [Edaphobacter sp.]|nr:hypothetical protein [Edaphobacter sp.]